MLGVVGDIKTSQEVLRVIGYIFTKFIISM